jgi:hypothetical protein
MMADRVRNGSARGAITGVTPEMIAEAVRDGVKAAFEDAMSPDSAWLSIAVEEGVRMAVSQYLYEHGMPNGE